MEAYGAGINAWIAEGHTLPPEFLILGVKPDAWTPIDSLVWAKMMSWDLGGDWDLELLRAELTQAIGPERTADPARVPRKRDEHPGCRRIQPRQRRRSPGL
ncbi:MAG: penicillin acylase family protein [Caldilineaceae bacterium]